MKKYLIPILLVIILIIPAIRVAANNLYIIAKIQPFSTGEYHVDITEHWRYYDEAFGVGLKGELTLGEGTLFGASSRLVLSPNMNTLVPTGVANSVYLSGGLDFLRITVQLFVPFNHDVLDHPDPGWYMSQEPMFKFVVDMSFPLFGGHYEN